MTSCAWDAVEIWQHNVFTLEEIKREIERKTNESSDLEIKEDTLFSVLRVCNDVSSPAWFICHPLNMYFCTHTYTVRVVDCVMMWRVHSNNKLHLPLAHSTLDARINLRVVWIKSFPTALIRAWNWKVWSWPRGPQHSPVLGPVHSGLLNLQFNSHSLFYAHFSSQPTLHHCFTIFLIFHCRSNIRPENATFNSHHFRMHTFERATSCSSCHMLLRWAAFALLRPFVCWNKLVNINWY